MTRFNQNWTIVKGESANVRIPVVDEDGATLDISGSSAITFDASLVEGGTASISKTLATITVTSSTASANDTVNVPIETSDIATLAAGRYYTRCYVTLTAGPRLVASGVMSLRD